MRQWVWVPYVTDFGMLRRASCAGGRMASPAPVLGGEEWTRTRSHSLRELLVGS